MDVSTVLAPDGIEPLVGYRAWRFALDRQGVSLYSLGGPGCFGSSWDVAVFGWATAACRVDRRRRLRPVSDHACDGTSGCLVCGPAHRAPQEGCSCGFYAMKELEPLTLFPHREGDLVIGRVDLAGKVIEHDFGYRAERARIAELIPVTGAERAALRVANRLGLRLGAPPRPGKMS
ncbi:MAG: hypothetical protein E6G37_09900 [Actinobacteria bacterium]|nr:MAG: hypothetical protein E6G37_09900 [Actinomycetota bacterium]